MLGGKQICPLKRCKFVENENSKNCGANKDDGESCVLLGDSMLDSDLDSDSDSGWETRLFNPSKKVKGRYLAVVPFLSNKGKTTHLVRSNGEVVCLDIVRGKYLLICCVNLPVSADDIEFQYCHSMIGAYSELSRADFEMVLVVKMKNGFDDEKAAFDNFFSAFPCLAIPFSELETRVSICSFIGFKHSFLYSDVVGIVVDPTGRILHYRSTHEDFVLYGSEWFPFHATKRKIIDTQDDVLRMRLDPFYKKFIKRDAVLSQPLSLHKDILLCDPSRKLSRIGGAHQSLTVLELSNKYVGLYLCSDTHFMGQLNEAYKQCIAKEQEFEIVLVCLPLFEEQKLYNRELFRQLKRYNITSWFIFPYDNKVCRRLWRVFGQALTVDKLIILPPNCECGELEGRAAIDELGMETYPFTRSTILEQRFTALKSLNPASWFNGSRKTTTCLVRNGRKSNVSWSELDGKKLLIYFDWLKLSDDHGKLCSLLMKHYPEIQAIGCEVVFVPLNTRDEGPHHVKLAKMPWPIMPVAAAVESSVTSRLIFQGEGYSKRLIAFGENGEILSRRVHKRLEKYGVSDYLFRDKLRKEIIAYLVSIPQEDELF